MKEKTGKSKTRLHFEDELKKPKSQSKLTFEAERLWERLEQSLSAEMALRRLSADVTTVPLGLGKWITSVTMTVFWQPLLCRLAAALRIRAKAA